MSINISFNSFFNQPLTLFKKLKRHFHDDNLPAAVAVATTTGTSAANILCAIHPDFSDLKRPIIAKPIHICDFWLDRQRNVYLGRDGFKYYDHKSFASKPKLDFHLSAGIETFDPRPLDEGLNNILNYILHVTEPNTPLKQAVKNADFVCFRGTLSALAVTAYSHDDTGFKFVILKFQGVFFIMQLDTDAVLEERAHESKRSKLLTYWGQKFESYIFAAKGEMPDSKSPVSTWNETLAAFQMSLNQTSINRPINLFYCAEIDGLDKNTGRHIEAKTTEKINLSKPYAAQKSLKWWIQSYLAGIDKIILGTRTHNGIVKKLEWLNLSEIKQKSRMHWNPNVCMQSVYRILDSIREFYDKNVGMDEMIEIEKRPNLKTIHYLKISSKKYPVLSTEFCKFFDHGNVYPPQTEIYPPQINVDSQSSQANPPQVNKPKSLLGEYRGPPPPKKQKLWFFQ